MISKIFENTKPANVLIVLAIGAITYLVFEIFLFQRFFNSYSFFIESVTALLFLLFTIVVINSIAHKERFTQNNSFAILFFGLMVSLFPNIYINLPLVFSNFLCFLALWRLTLLKNRKHIVQKIFDASVLFSLSWVFVPWTILFLFIVWLALIFFGIQKKRYWFIPIMSWGSVIILYFAMTIVLKTEIPFGNRFSFSLGWDDFSSTSLPFLFSVSVLSLVFIVTIIYTTFFKPPQLLESKWLITAYLWISLGVAFLSGNVIFIFPTLAIFFAVFVQNIRIKWLKESIFLALLLFPVGVLLLHFVSKG